MTKGERKIKQAGSILIASGIVLIGWFVLGLFLPNKAHVYVDNSIIICLVGVFLIVLGILLLRLRAQATVILQLMLGLLITVFLFLGVEGTFFLLNKGRADTVWVEEGGLYQEDELLGYKAGANNEFTSMLMIKGSEVFNVTYSIDKFGRRVTPLVDNGSREKFLLFFGDSFTFGYGVENDETLPYYLADLAPDFQPYNFGLNGYGTQQMAAFAQNQQFLQGIEEDQGVIIYTFIDPHVSRDIGSLRVVNQWGDRMPYYRLDPDGRLQRVGNFLSGRPLLTTIYKLLGNSQVIRYFGLDIPRLNEAHFKLTAKLIQESRDRLVESFPGTDFYVLFFPGYSHYAPRLIPYLEEAEIDYLDYSGLFEIDEGEYWLRDNGHPSSLGYRLVASQIAKDLALTPER